ncbi:MAG TPA: ScyD/ScyE family protein [Micromonosporaceae bacterium]
MLRRPVHFAAITTLALGAIALAPTGASAQQIAFEEVSSTIEVVADGLNAPRGLYYDREQHRVLVAEAGVVAGNTGPCGFAERGLPMCFGKTGSIFQYWESGSAGGRIVTGLPSTALQADATVVIGLHDLTLRDDRLVVSFGALGNLAYRESLGPDASPLGQLATVNGSDKVKPFADILSFIEQRYPIHLEADPYGIAVGPYGTVVANAGGHDSMGNNLLLVSNNGAITELAQFPDRAPAADPTRTIRAVPTTVAQGPDGAFYVGELSGAPFYPNEARVWRVVPGQPATVYAQGFTTIIDIAFDEQGRLIVLQTSGDPFDTELDGALIRVEPDGQRTVIASTGLRNPGGVAVVGDGVFYVTTRMASGGGVGQLVRITEGA